jgi:hypothetical protein
MEKIPEHTMLQQLNRSPSPNMESIFVEVMSLELDGRLCSSLCECGPRHSFKLWVSFNQSMR